MDDWIIGWMYVRMHAHRYVRTRTCCETYARKRAYTYIRMCLYVGVCVCKEATYVYKRVCMYLCSYVGKYTLRRNTRTYMHA
jgi:hypothetical protein